VEAVQVVSGSTGGGGALFSWNQQYCDCSGLAHLLAAAASVDAVVGYESCGQQGRQAPRLRSCTRARLQYCTAGNLYEELGPSSGCRATPSYFNYVRGPTSFTLQRLVHTGAPYTRASTLSGTVSGEAAARSDALHSYLLLHQNSKSGGSVTETWRGYTPSVRVQLPLEMTDPYLDP
jgi:hypothetical protein